MKNPLQLSHKMNAPFVCNMDLRMFPFDTQHCKLLLTLTSARIDFLEWRRLEVTYLGEVDIYIFTFCLRLCVVLTSLCARCTSVHQKRNTLSFTYHVLTHPNRNVITRKTISLKCL